MYEFPYITKYLRKVTCFSYVPFSPTFDKEITCSCCTCCGNEDKNQEDLPLEIKSNNYVEKDHMVIDGNSKLSSVQIHSDENSSLNGSFNTNL